MTNQRETYTSSGNNSNDEFSKNLNISSQYQYQTIPNEFPSNETKRVSITESTYSTFRYKNCLSILILLFIGYYYLIKQSNKEIPKSVTISFLLISILLSVTAISLLLYNNFWNTSADIKFILINYYQTNYICANLLLSLSLFAKSFITQSIYLLIISFSLSAMALSFYFQVYMTLQGNQRRNRLFTSLITYIAFDLPISLLLGWGILFMIESYLSVAMLFKTQYFIVILFVTLTSVAIVNMTYCKDIFFSSVILFYQCELLITKYKNAFRINCLLTLFTILSVVWSLIANIRDNTVTRNQQENQNDAIKIEYYDQES